MDCSRPGLPVHHQLLEPAQTHVHRVGDAIQPSHPLLSPFPLAFNLSQHQGLFQWVSSSHQVAKVLEFQLQHQSFQWIFRTDFLYHWLVWSPCSPRETLKNLLQHHSSKASILWCSAFFLVQLSHPHMTTGKTIALTRSNFLFMLELLLIPLYRSPFLEFLSLLNPNDIFLPMLIFKRKINRESQLTWLSNPISNHSMLIFRSSQIKLFSSFNAIPKVSCMLLCSWTCHWL